MLSPPLVGTVLINTIIAGTWHLTLPIIDGSIGVLVVSATATGSALSQSVNLQMSGQIQMTQSLQDIV